ncbi:PP2C family serine/threonine-protein phosphatase [[Phormidium] sp. ETS-05]|uniref:PP2C family protein-serine/threonine phosphatase n=1 Tax=[Phormidium] sp. ETS-05 TaxID=222819 RepID=UPI0018EEF816|nr:protein phosphatase 2C domain-containing protein [[Phormidium] sp. ETS-05]
MSIADSSSPIYCVNSSCTDPSNVLGTRFCAACQTPLVYRYLWAVGGVAAQISPGSLMADRYWVVAPQIWLDTSPALPPELPETPPEEILPYLQLYPLHLHVPLVYGFCSVGENGATQLLLLENVPVDGHSGNLYPAMMDLWKEAPGVRQVYWLWQILQLWTPLLQMGVASSLLKAENIRVQGWRVWLRELYGDAGLVTKPDLQDLGYHWLTWTGRMSPPLGDRLQDLGKQMRRPGAEVEDISRQLNALLLEMAARLPIRLRVVSGTDSGPQRDHNEDACYPTVMEEFRPGVKSSHPLAGRLAIVCDGVGGHEGGEVASQLAVNALKLGVGALVTEVASESEITPPHQVGEQLAAIARVVNNTIATQNDAQGRSARERMATTLAMALQLAQKIPTKDGVFPNGHELYLLNIGDSRVYWLTADYCQQLTTDDDIATREVRLGRMFYRQALRRPDAGALTQALGTKDGDLIRPHVERLILEEDGLLLLCSDGLSDNDLVETSALDIAAAVLADEMSLEDATAALIRLANEKNGHDNTSVVLIRCRISPEKLALFNPKRSTNTEDELSEASKALLYDNSEADLPSIDTESDTPSPRSPRPVFSLPLSGSQNKVLGVLAAVILGGLLGFLGFRLFSPEKLLSPDRPSPPGDVRE